MLRMSEFSPETLRLALRDLLEAVGGPGRPCLGHVGSATVASGARHLTKDEAYPRRSPRDHALRWMIGLRAHTEWPR